MLSVYCIRLPKEANTDDRVTILVVADYVTRIYMNQELKGVDVIRIRRLDKGTKFAEAFSYVIRVIQQLQQDLSYKKFQNVIILMSDREANYSDSELNTLPTIYRGAIAKFWTVVLGAKDRNVLSLINKTMHGEYKNIKESCDLVEAYVDIAQDN
ncbi:unnamed protein product [Didymodactylos carnosus]|uniref:VWFA domain-containing protein n=1 Tax=Didymodactylos carnosus TaxID=1234261 RepID=A0A816C6X9_9BILA|nr:unnamed protein product [Didymodactylos carnosus]CAF1619557.1 unnamed protein product [Didymodactylos carnosus]CAF3863013.1 unnamed protein product [Didymodactylos carnosus]CAF4508591.1 unnamed protein product [Didymodactylos carnosus]